jgi:hypothetical protein
MRVAPWPRRHHSRHQPERHQAVAASDPTRDALRQLWRTIRWPLALQLLHHREGVEMSMLDITHQLATQQARAFDETIMAIVKEQAGIDDALMLHGRLTAVTSALGPEVTYCLDGKPFAVFWPPEVLMNGWTITVTQQYRKL